MSQRVVISLLFHHLILTIKCPLAIGHTHTHAHTREIAPIRTLDISDWSIGLTGIIALANIIALAGITGRRPNSIWWALVN